MPDILKMAIFLKVNIILSLSLSALAAFNRSYTPGWSKTVGQPWPLPLSFTQTAGIQSLSVDSFIFSVVGYRCDILDEATSRYDKIIFGRSRSNKQTVLRFKSSQATKSFDLPRLDSLDVYLLRPCEVYPSLEMLENYDLTVSLGSAKLQSPSIWGILRGLETFSQLIYETSDGQWVVNDTDISDAPRFAHRGLLLDTSRHFIVKDILKENLDAMAYNKMNVFHWHIVDDQSFPYQSRKFPNITLQGAFDPYSHIYTQNDIAEIVEYARMRGIRVVAEFDSPGHSQSWGVGQEGLLTKCYNAAGQFDGTYGPIDPTLSSTYSFLYDFTQELSQVFPDRYLHLGGDEVSFDCWKSNPQVTAFMKSRQFGTDYSKLEQYYMQQLLNIVSSHGNGYIIWQEVVDNGVTVRPDTVVEVWKGGQEAEMARVTALGLRAILSSCWYLNYISYGDDWKKYYQCDPQAFNGTDAQKKLVIGGEMCMWGEYVDSSNVISRTWPRGSAVAERLWSRANLTDPNLQATRLEEHRCRLIERGIRAEPVVGPGYCKHEFNRIP